MTSKGTAFAIGAGIAAGVGTSLALSSARSPNGGMDRLRASAIASASPNQESDAPRLESEIADLRSRMSALASSNAAVPNAAPSATAAHNPASDPAAIQRELFARHADMIAAHWQEPLDRAWATSATQSFHDDLEQKAAVIPIKVTSVDCRSATCLAEIQYPNYHQALDARGKLGRPRYSQHCATDIADPPPEDLEAPYSATIVFDCGNR